MSIYLKNKWYDVIYDDFNDGQDIMVFTTIVHAIAKFMGM